MGFVIVPERQGSGGGIFAYKILARGFSLSGTERVSYSVEYYSERERYADSPKPFAIFSGFGEHLPDGTVQLPARAYCFD
uniref:hypothetical protein n=1 Tax=Sphingomonas sp. dw_22 TaxID=2721175 RepID=UPI001BD33F00